MCPDYVAQALKYPLQTSHQPVKLIGTFSRGTCVIIVQVEQEYSYISALVRPELSSNIAACKRENFCLRFYKEVRIGLANASAS